MTTTTWGYLVFDFEDNAYDGERCRYWTDYDKLEADLNVLGAQGWELVSVLRGKVVLKRPTKAAGASRKRSRVAPLSATTIPPKGD